MTGVVLRTLTEPEKARRAAALIVAGQTVTEKDIALLAREFTSIRYARPMDTAPRDGTHILAFLYTEPDDCGYRGFGEWREIWWKPYSALGMEMPWHAGDPFDSHTHGEAPEHFGEGVPIAWLPIPDRPAQAR